MKESLWKIGISSLILFLFILAPFTVFGAEQGSAPTAPKQIHKWRLEAFYPPPDDRFNIGLRELTKRIKDSTDGQVDITIYPGGALVPSPEIFKSVADGILQMGVTAPSYHMGIMSFTIATELPFSFRNPDDVVKVMLDKGLRDFMREEYAKRGVHLLTWQSGDALMILSKKPLRTKEDFKGVKIRGYGVYNAFLSKIGASPVNIPLVETYTALSMGTVDGALTGIGGHFSLKLYESAKYAMMPYVLGETMHDVTVSLKTWKSLPNDLQGRITSVADDFAKWSIARFRGDYERGMIDKMKKAGLQLVEIPPETKDWLQTTAMEQWKEIAAKDANSAKAVKIVSDYLKEAGAIKK